jgi:hypothetical protein
MFEKANFMANKPYQPMNEPADGETDAPDSGETPYQVTLDKSNPDIAEAFAECKEGDMYKVVKDDENEIVLEKQPEMSQEETDPEEQPQGGGEEEQPGGEEDNSFKSEKPGIALLIAKKRKQ